jgi:hypothetical protein
MVFSLHIPTLKKRFSFSLITSCPFSFQMRPNLHIQKTTLYRDVVKGKRLRQKKGNGVCKRHDASVYSLFCRRRNNQVQNNGRDSQGSYEDLFATIDFNKSAIVSLCNANVEYDVSSTSTTLLSSLQLRRYSSIGLDFVPSSVSACHYSRAYPYDGFYHIHSSNNRECNRISSTHLRHQHKTHHLTILPATAALLHQSRGDLPVGPSG